MNSTLMDTIVKHTPVINKKITDGTAKQVLDSIPAYMDEFFKSSLGSLSPKIDFKYVGYRRVSPKEEYDNITTARPGTVSYDIVRNNVYIVEFRFEYQGKLITRHIYLPYAEDGNIMVMGGANYHITPVLSDTVISPSDSGVFIRLLRAKLNFSSRSRYFLVNGVKTAGNIIYGDILLSKQVTDMIGRPLTATSLYLLGKYGLVDSLKRYGNVEDVIVTTDDISTGYEDYVSFASMQIKPRGLKAVPYIPHNVKILVKGSNMDMSYVENLLYGVIYTIDILPEIESDVIGTVNGGNLNMEISFWRIVLGRVIYKNSYSVDRISQDLDDHFNTLNGYIDNLILTKMKEAGIQATNFFELIALLITNYNHWVLTSKEYNSNIENRYIDILYYLTYDLVVGFNRAILSLNKRITKTKSISHKEVEKVLGDELSRKKVYGLTKTTEPNLAVTSVDYSGDLKYPKVTSILEDQSRGNGVKRGKTSTLPESAKTLKAGDLVFGSLLFLGKNLPSPRFKMNMFMDYDLNTGKIRYPTDIKRALEKLSVLLQGMESNKHIANSELEATGIKASDL